MNENRTLTSNKINQFILRIDFENKSQINFQQLTEVLRDYFLSYKTELRHNYNVDIRTVQVNKEDFLKYIFETSDNLRVELDSFEKAIIIQTGKYKDSSTYTGCLTNLIQVLTEMYPNTTAKRIGMRFVNLFPCSKYSEVSKYLQSAPARSIRESSQNEHIARVINIHEYQYGDCLARVQYGMPNKFFPSILTSYDVLLDIDVYSGGLQSITSWEENIRSYNHYAYDLFTAYVKDSLLEELK